MAARLDYLCSKLIAISAWVAVYRALRHALGLYSGDGTQPEPPTERLLAFAAQRLAGRSSRWPG